MKKKTLRVVKLCLLLVLLFSSGMWAHFSLNRLADAAAYKEAKALAHPASSGQDRRPVMAASPEQTDEEDSLACLDLEALRSVNPDVVGWIEIPGTELSYPLMQGSNNRYYLSHNWKKEGSSGGSVFLECTNSPELTDFHTIAYAHRMNDNTMFGTLKYYRELDYWQEHPSVYVALDGGIYRYDIFSAQEASVKGIVYRLDIEENQLEGEFLQYCIENSLIDTGLTPESSDHILTLSTCTGNGHATRWVVHGVLSEHLSYLG